MAVDMSVPATSDISTISLQDKVCKNVEITTSTTEQADEANNGKSITVSHMIGEFGFYQLSLTLLAFLRYVILAMMTNTGPLIAPDVEFWCHPDPDRIPSIKIPANTTLNDYLRGKCSLDLLDGRGTYQCNSWVYNTTQYGVTLTDSFDLVCGRDYYRSIFQSIVSVGVMVASVIWGAISDAHGRNLTIRICFVISTLAGVASYLARSFFLYVAARAFCSFSDLGLVVSLSTIIVELLGNKYRGAVCIIVYTGWSCGVMVMPWLTEYFRDYRQLMMFTLICHLCTLPWLLTVGESIRWLMIHGRLGDARSEVLRIIEWNRSEELLYYANDRFEAYSAKFASFVVNNKPKLVDPARVVAKTNWTALICKPLLGGFSKVSQLFHIKEIAISTVTMIWISFTCELLYMLFTLINSDIGENVKLNYAIGGAMEILATIISIVIISKVSRKLSLTTLLASIACLIVVLAFTHHLPMTSVWVLNADKLAISTLSSLIFVTTTEIFPTNLRQTGFGLCGTLGSLGAVIAPFIRTELTNKLGMTNVMLMVAIFPLIAAIIIPFFLRETKDVELSDEVNDLE